MKKGIKILFSVFICLFMIEKYRILVKADSTMNTTIITTEYQEAIVRAIDNDTVCSMNQTYYNQYHVVIDKPTICYSVVNTTIYGIYYSGTRSILYAYNMSDKSYIEETIYATIYDMIYYDEKLVLVGNENEDACLYNYQKNLTLINKKCFGGDGYESFTKVISFHGKLLIFGLKDAFSSSSCFLNVGNSGDLKSFVIIIDEKNEIEKQLYVNENTSNETIVDVKCDDLFCSFLVKDDKDTYHQYKISDDLSVELKVDLNSFQPNLISIIPNVKDYPVIYLYTKGKSLYLGLLEEKTIHPIYIGDYDYFYCLDIRKGKLEILLKDNQRVKQLIVDEYHINAIHDFYYNEFTLDYKNTNHFNVSSYFEDLTFIFDEQLNSYIDYQSSGNYVASYSAKRLDGSLLTVETNYVIPPFVNIIDGGVYDTQFPLLFTDTLYVDDEKKSNGDRILTTGKHILKHITKEKTEYYTIYVYEEGSTTNQNYLETDFTIFYPTTFYFKMSLDEEKEIESIIVNHKSHPFVLENGMIYIPIHATTPGNIDIYTINSIIYSDHRIDDIDKTFTVRTLYQPCIIETSYEDKSIIYQLKDANHVVLDIVIKTYQNDQLIGDVHYPLNHISYVVPKTLSKVIFYIRYCLGDKEIFEVELGSFLISAKGKKDNYIYFEIEKDDEEASIKVYPIYHKNMNIEEVIVQDKNLTNAYIIEENRVIIYITIITSILMIICIAMYFIIKMSKKRKCILNKRI